MPLDGDRGAPGRRPDGPVDGAHHRRSIAHASTVVLAGTGHMGMLERADASTDEVLSWARGHPPGA